MAPKDLGDIRVTLPDGKQMPLQAAIDKHILEIRGINGYSAVEFRNLLPAGVIKVAVRRNSVVMPDSSYETADLKGLPELQATRLETQSALWASRSQQQAVVVTGARLAAPARDAVRRSAPLEPAVADPTPPPPR